ncbi:MAG: hypothetical protein PHI50_00270 [Alphaproteobacteria bacterium]|nr:hypothetical protein [Alphaproteobacteria bacterium]
MCFFKEPKKFYQLENLETLKKNFYSSSSYKLDERNQKIFYEEVNPLISLALHLDVNSVCFTGTTNKHYDAVFRLNNGKEQKIEVTTSIPGEKISLEKEVLKKYGICFHIPNMSGIKFKKLYRITGTKQSRKIGGYNSEIDDFEDGDISNPEKIKKNINTDIDRITKKFKEYYQGSWLLLYTNHPFPEVEELKSSFLIELTKKIQNLDNNPFEKIFICNNDLGNEFVEEIYSNP